MKKVLGIVLFLINFFFGINGFSQSKTNKDSTTIDLPNEKYIGILTPNVPILNQNKLGVFYEWSVTPKRSWTLEGSFNTSPSRREQYPYYYGSLGLGFRKYFYRTVKEKAANGWFFGGIPTISYYPGVTGSWAGGYLSAQIGHKFYFNSNFFFDLSYALGAGYIRPILNSSSSGQILIVSELKFIFGFRLKQKNTSK